MALEPAEIIRNHQLGVWRYLRFLGADEQAADDLTQEVFVAVLAKPFDYHSHAQTNAYLRAVARNLFVSALRKNRREVSLDDLAAREAAWERNDGDDPEPRRQALDACLEQLPRRSRQVVEAYYAADDNRASVAARVGMTEEALKKLLWRVREALRQCVEKRLGHA